MDFQDAAKLLFREAWFQDAVLYLDRIDSLRDDAHSTAFDSVLEALAEDGGIAIVAGTAPWHVSRGSGPEMITVEFRLPDFAGRRSEWQAMLMARGVLADESTLDALADRFRLSPVQIAAAVSNACSRARLRASSERVSATGSPEPSVIAAQGDRARLQEPSAAPDSDDLFSAARAQCAGTLGALAHKIDPRYTWDDIVLPEDALAQLREICQRVAHRHRVLGEWGFNAKLSLGKGVNALFAGPSGTGKTMAAEIIANELRLDLYRIDLAGVVSKYIGETEKNLDRVFEAAESANAILFFDEADALFGKRSEVHDSHDRYANIEISYLLQKMEEYDGITILATNLRQNIDDAFMRRLAFTVHFPFPDETSRRKIWEGIWPAEAPMTRDVNLKLMARRFKLSGGNIKNIALASAFLAAEHQQPVAMAHLLRATRREHQKMGKTLSESELEEVEHGLPSRRDVHALSNGCDSAVGGMAHST
jgi:AAA+ superfamily predicted ATPase